MRFYRATSFNLPRSLRFRLAALCIGATHLPLLAYIGWGAATGRLAWAEFIILMLASAAGAAGALLGVDALMKPNHASVDESPTLPAAGDIIARLLAVMRGAAGPGAAERGAELAMATHEDALTGIANRRGFLAQLDALPLNRRRGCIALIDLDHFRQIADQLGHAAADHLLSDFAARLSSETRRVDMIGRWGDEEFAIFYQDAIEDEASWSLARIADRMRREPCGTVNGQPITFSAGFCAWRGGPVGAAITNAYEALDRARRSGRDQIQRAERNAAQRH